MAWESIGTGWITDRVDYEENGNEIILCPKCHLDYDNGKYRREIEKLFREHLMAHYPGWDENGLTYKKWRDL